MVQNTDEFDIGTLWEQRIVFDLRPLRRRIDRISIFDEEDTMGVADADSDWVCVRTSCNVEMLGVHGAGQREVLPVQLGRAHIDGNQTPFIDMAWQQSGDGFDG